MKKVKYTYGLLKILCVAVSHGVPGRRKQEYYLHKGNIWAAMGHYELAVKNYKKALAEEEKSDVYAALGWCYAVLDLHDLSLESYRKAHKNIKHDSSEVTMGLAYAEGKNGNLFGRHELLENMRQAAGERREEIEENFDDLEKRIFAERAKK